MRKLFTPNSQISDDEKYLLYLRHCSLKSESEEWLTSTEVSQYLKISKKTLMNKVSLGHIPRYKLGRLNRYKKSEIEGLILPTRSKGESRWE